jgi:predicted MPP superfamily phosphohydrolase
LCRDPEGRKEAFQVGGTVKRAAKTSIGAALAAILLLGGVLAYGAHEAASRPIERRLTVGFSLWPRDAGPLDVALLADIHLGNRAMNPRRLAAIVAQVNAAHPDLVLIAGDFLAGRDGVGAAERAAALQAPLSRLRAPLGVVAVLGNHDHWTVPDAVRRVLVRAGVTVLANAATRRGPVTILGVDDAFSGRDDIAATLASSKGLGGIPIVLTHTPDLVHKLRGAFPLVLAGHTHCGQVVLPWYGPLLTRAPREGWKPLYDPRYRCGIVRDPGRLVLVTAGLGSGTAPIRLGAPPDWWLVRVGPRR